MSVYAGPEIPQSGLVFAYDMYNNSKSWKGAPLTNLAFGNFFSGNANFNINQTVTDFMPDGSLGNARELNAATIVDPNRTVSIGSYALTAGSTYTLSFYVKNINCTGFGGNLYSPTLGGSIAGITYPTIINNTWVRVTTTFTVPTGSGTPVTVSPQVFRDAGLGLFRLCWLQLEERSFATPYVENTRSTTQSILDLTNISTVTVNGLNYTSNNYATINGTSSYIAITNSANLRPSSELTIEYVIKGPTAGSWRPILGYGNGDYSTGNYLVWVEGGGLLNSLCRINNAGTVTEYRQYPGVVISDTTYQQMTFTMKVGQSIRSYKNGVDTNTPTSLPAGGSFYYAGTTSPYQIGGAGGSWLVADVPFVRLYNRALSENEISQNFNALRGRFGI